MTNHTEVKELELFYAKGYSSLSTTRRSAIGISYFRRSTNFSGLRRSDIGTYSPDLQYCLQPRGTLFFSCFHSLGDAPLGPSSNEGLLLTFQAKKVWS